MVFIKLLKCPNSPNIVCIDLAVKVLVAIAEVLVPRGGSSFLGGAPIALISKTANCDPVKVKFVQFISRWQIPITVSV